MVHNARARLIGRDAQLSAVVQYLHAATVGSGTTMVVAGEGGTGKSQLVKEVCAAAASAGMMVLSGRSVPEAAPPMRALAEALVTGTHGIDLSSAAELAPYRAMLAPLIPGLAETGGDPTSPAFSIPLAEGVRRLVEHLADASGLLLVLEDMHWADVDSVLVLEYLSDHLENTPVVVIATARPQPGTPWSVRLHSMHARGSVQLIELPPIDAQGVAELSAELLHGGSPPKELTRWLVEWSDGYPGLVRTLVKLLISAGDLRSGPEGWSFTVPERIRPELVPAGIRDELASGTASLPAAHLDVLRYGACLGRNFNANLLPTLTGQGVDQVEAALRELVTRRVLEIHEVGVRTHRFSRALTHVAVLGEFVGYRRAEIAAVALRTVRSEHPDLANGWSGYAAELAETAGDVATSAVLLLESGRTALETGSLADAERAFERARGLATESTVRVDAEIELLRVLLLAGRIDEAHRLGRYLVGSLDAAQVSADQRIEIQLMLARVSIEAGEFGTARGHLDAVATSLENDQIDTTPDRAGRRSAVRALAAATEANFAICREQDEEAAKLARRAIDEAIRAGLAQPVVVETVCEAHQVLGLSQQAWNTRRAEEEFTAALRTAEDHRLPVRRLFAMNALCRLESMETLRTERLEVAEASANAAGAVLASAESKVVLAAIRSLRMELPESLRLARQCEDLGRTLGIGAVVPRALVVQAVGHALAQQRDDMETSIEQALRCRDVTPAMNAYLWGQARAAYSLHQEDRQQALTELDTALEGLPAQGGRPWPMVGLAVLLRTLEDRDAASLLTRARGSAWGTFPLIRAHLNYADAIAHGRAGRVEQAMDAFEDAERAFQLLDGAEWLHHRAWRLVAEAAIADGWGDPAQWLRAALSTFVASGHTQLASTCRAMLRQLGVPVPRQRSSVPNPAFQYGITVRELEVLHLIAEKLPSVEIGRRLGISARTAEKHIERLKAKTGERSRQDLAVWLQRHADIRNE